MSRHAFHEIFLHITWHNDHNKPITPATETLLHEAILAKCRMTSGVFVHGIGGTETHIHLAISIEPNVMISDFVGQVKGASSHEMNEQFTDRPIDWIRGYGVVSFSKRDLPWVLHYIRNQKQHHQQGTLSDKLERISIPEENEHSPLQRACHCSPPPSGGGVEGG